MIATCAAQFMYRKYNFNLEYFQFLTDVIEYLDQSSQNPTNVSLQSLAMLSNRVDLLELIVTRCKFSPVIFTRTWMCNPLYMSDPNEHYNMIGSLLSRLLKEDVISMIVQMVEHLVAINCYNIYGAVHVILHRPAGNAQMLSKQILSSSIVSDYLIQFNPTLIIPVIMDTFSKCKGLVLSLSINFNVMQCIDHMTLTHQNYMLKIHQLSNFVLQRDQSTTASIKIAIPGAPSTLNEYFRSIKPHMVATALTLIRHMFYHLGLTGREVALLNLAIAITFMMKLNTSGQGNNIAEQCQESVAIDALLCGKDSTCFLKRIYEIQFAPLVDVALPHPKSAKLLANIFYLTDNCMPNEVYKCSKWKQLMADDLLTNTARRQRIEQQRLPKIINRHHIVGFTVADDSGADMRQANTPVTDEFHKAFQSEFR